MVRLAGAFAAATVTTVVLSGCGGGGGDTTTQQPDKTTTQQPDKTTTQQPDTPTTPQPTPKATKSIAELAKATKDLSTLYAAWTASDVSEKLNKDSKYTVFAPTNAAFAALEAADKELVPCLLTTVGKPSLTKVIENHVVEGEMIAAKLKNDQELTTLEGDKVKVSIDEATSTVKVGAATVVMADIMATNGVIHEIDAVLVPGAPWAKPQCGSCGTIGACAVFASKKVPPEGATLVKALTAADLVPTLEDKTKLLTVFAPTDAAFGEIDPTLLTCLLDPVNKATLGNILKFHVVEGYVLAADVTDKMTSATLDGDNKLTFGVSDKAVTVTGGTVTATVTTPNLYANNGVTHVIDKVLIPTGVDCPAKMTTTTKPTSKITSNQIQV